MTGPGAPGGGEDTEGSPGSAAEVDARTSGETDPRLISDPAADATMSRASATV